MMIHASITLRNKSYSYTLEKKRDGLVHIVCKAAKINQEFLPEDVSELILDLPEHIRAEQNYTNKQGEVVRFRISGPDKKRIEQKAYEKGYSSISSYLRDLALK